MSQNKGAVIEDNNYDNEISEFFEEKKKWPVLFSVSRFKLIDLI